MVASSGTLSSSSSLPCYSDVPDTGVRRREVRFVAQSDVDAWLRERRVVLDGPLMMLVGSEKRYAVQEAARILGPHAHCADLFGMTGRIVPITELFALGATVSSGTLRLGMAEYDLQMGLLVYKLLP
jgi:hypothetical protein